MRNLLFTTVSLGAMVIAGAAQADGHGPIKVGVLQHLKALTLHWEKTVFAALKQQWVQMGRQSRWQRYRIDHPINRRQPDSAVRGARKLVEQDKVDIVIGPLSGSEGIAIRDYSKTQPGTTFINGISGALETTYVTPSENFFRSTLMVLSGQRV